MENNSGKSRWDKERINSLIKKMISGEIKPMIIVITDSSNKFGGSFYANFVTTGNWENLIAFEIPGFIDKNYRTLPKTLKVERYSWTFDGWIWSYEDSNETF